ncbi:MAG TPA: phage terminase large subunit [Gemmatimonadales bacterium]|nr:phage terminase large subunit [Gemmatimonadales bacterium]
MITETEWRDRIGGLSAADQAALAASLTPKLTRYVAHTPTPPQTAFLLLDDLEALYGGAAGGGKSDALLMGALAWVDHPEHRAILFRRTFPELMLPGSLLDRADAWLRGTDAAWNGQEYEWRFPSGATVGFGYLAIEGDKHRYQSANFTYIGFDELTTFRESQYTYLASRLRRPEGVTIPLKLRAGSNPGGPGHDWVRQRFMVEGEKEHRAFIPARLEDNPFLDQEAYERSLALLDPITKAQLREGDWDARPKGSMFDRAAVDIVERGQEPRVIRRVRRWDFAATEERPGQDPDYTVGCRIGVTDDGIYVVDDVLRVRKNPGGVDALVFATAEADGLGTEVTMEQEPGSAGKHVVSYYQRHPNLRGYIVRGKPSTGSKEDRARPLSAQWYAGNVVLVRGPWLTDFLNEVEVFPDPQVHDDQVDAMVGGYEDLTFLTAGRFQRR